jgi:serine/threonine-protein kinase
VDETFGHYRIVEELGRGGMGVVYKAYEESLNRYVALKVLGEHLTQDSSFVTRFVREAQSAASLHHPNVVQIFFIGEERGRHYFAMEFVEGRSVRDIIAERGRLPYDEALDLILQAAAGLEAAHSRGVLHRDIKPANMIVTADGRLKIADFGLALPVDVESRLTASGALLGTPAYVSPEVCEGLKPDRRSDIYALGLTLYEMLAGRVPFQADSPMGLLRQILQTEPPPIRELDPDVDPRLESILGRMMAKDREQRFESCQEIIAELEAFRRGETRGTRHVVPPPPVGTVPAVAEPVTEQPTILLAEESALVPRVESLPAARSSRVSGRTALIAVAVLVLLLASAATAAVLLLGRQWSSMRESDSADSLLARVAALVPGARDEAGDAATSGAAEPSGEQATAYADRGPGTLEGETPPPTGSFGEPPSQVEATGSPETAAASVGPPAAVAPSSGDDALAGASQSSDAGRPPAAPATSFGTDPHPPSPSPTMAATRAPSGEARPRAERPRAPPLPARPRVAVVGSGEPLLAVAAEEWLEDELRERGVEVVAEDSVPEVADLLRQPLRVQDLLAALARNDIHVLVLAEADFVGERPLRYLGRSDRALRSRLRLNVFGTRGERALWRGWSGELEYTEINARRQAESGILPEVADLVARLDERWQAARRR